MIELPEGMSSEEKWVLHRKAQKPDVDYILRYPLCVLDSRDKARAEKHARDCPEEYTISRVLLIGVIK